jgi:ribonuclease Y
VVVISGFDPVRREIARVSLERLIQNGRIHPARIEEIVAKVTTEIEESMLDEGEKAPMNWEFRDSAGTRFTISEN